MIRRQYDPPAVLMSLPPEFVEAPGGVRAIFSHLRFSRMALRHLDIDPWQRELMVRVAGGEFRSSGGRVRSGCDLEAIAALWRSHRGGSGG